ncbi:MAG: VWA domain-containing protein [Pseudomonadota bacterium]
MRLLTTALLTTLPAFALAQDRANTILVLDGSGSMWGQIDGINKIVIARDVVGTLLDDFPADQNLGLTVYGHRERGNCADIETVVAPGQGNIDAIRSAVNNINPQGKTPMTDAIIAAAEALRYTEERATVILVSDGIETCNPDPCAAALALEQAGIDFTAHVVGFDVTDPEALAQMQCLADNTGGTFTTAADADELSAALQTVAVAPEPEPEPVVTQITFEARMVSEDGVLIETPVFWDVASDAGVLTESEMGNPLTLDLLEGSHSATAYWAEQEVEATRQFIATANPRTIVLTFEEPPLQASVTAPASAPIGSTIEVGWDGPGLSDDYIGISAAGEGRWDNFTYTREGNPLQFLMPTDPGTYEIHYFLGEGRALIGTTTIELTDVPFSITAPASSEIGQSIEIAWDGPDYDGDYIGIGPAGEGRWDNFTYTRDGNPLMLVMPPEPGEYEISYFMAQDRTQKVAVPITITEPQISVVAPETAVLGSMIEVAWKGPDLEGDYIGIGPMGEGRWDNFTYTRDGNPLMLEMPPEAGDYEISYFLGQDRTQMVVVPITLTDPEYGIKAPASAVEGSTIEVSWVGPDYRDDYIGIGRLGEGRWDNFTYTRDGTPLSLVIPPEAGDYEISYFLGQDRTQTIAVPITVTPVEITLTAPATAPAGGTIEVAWTGPNYRDDYIGISRAGEGRWDSWAYTRDGSVLTLDVPEAPGAYEIHYFFGQDRALKHTIPLTVE